MPVPPVDLPQMTRGKGQENGIDRRQEIGNSWDSGLPDRADHPQTYKNNKNKAPAGGTFMADAAAPVLDVRGLTTVFRTRGGEIHAVNDVSFTLHRGELLGVVGESGSGKSVTMMSLIKLLPMPPAEIRRGEVLLGGRDLLQMGPEALRQVRGGKVGFIFQDPMTSLNPVFRVGDQIMEPLRVHMGMTRAQARARAVELLELVGIPDAARRIDGYPHQFSGGMRQRVMIAIALACDPDVLIADEPTTALDVTIQAQILELVKDLRQKLGMAIIWITHDLGVIAGIADRVMVMYGGQVVEHAPVRELFARPQHPYTRALLQTIPRITGPRAARLRVIEGQPPILNAPLTACPFRARCDHRHEACDRTNPARRAVDGQAVGRGHDVACHWQAPAPDAARAEAAHV
jgi:peptide/nickel transport system ATP-binding protein/oligopeptide transport system ATP-binding protein